MSSIIFVTNVLDINLCFQINFLIDNHCKTQSEFSDIPKSHVFFMFIQGEPSKWHERGENINWFYAALPIKDKILRECNISPNNICRFHNFSEKQERKFEHC